MDGSSLNSLSAQWSFRTWGGARLTPTSSTRVSIAFRLNGLFGPGEKKYYEHTMKNVSIAFRLNGLFGRDKDGNLVNPVDTGLNSLSAQWSFRTGRTQRLEPW